MIDKLAPPGARSATERGGPDIIESPPTLQPDIDPAEALAKLEAAFAHLRRHFIHRDEVLEQIFFALLTREHSLIIGDRGLAKSRLARSIFAQFSDDRAPFSLQLTRTTSVGQLVGGLDLREFEKGTYVHNLDGYIVKAHFAFLDELFDANDFVLRALNGILNERQFLNGPQIEQASLHTAIATTNYIRDTRESRAVLDRFLFKSIVHRAESASERLSIRREFISSHGGIVDADPGHAAPYCDLHFISGIVVGENPFVRIAIAPHLLVILDELVSRYERKMNERMTGETRFVFSDRTKNKCVHVLFASALRSGRKAVELRDLSSLQYLVPTIGSPEEEEVFNDAISVTLKGFGTQDRESIDRCSGMIDLLEDVVAQHRAGSLEETSWSARAITRVERLFLHRKSDILTLGGMMDEARGLHADHAVVRQMKDELIAAIGAAHERHRISFDQKLHH